MYKLTSNSQSMHEERLLKQSKHPPEDQELKQQCCPHSLSYPSFCLPCEGLLLESISWVLHIDYKNLWDVKKYMYHQNDDLY
ncbi:hypothetical protein QJS04_geneDACA012871 [Acorus gramineus]|uniref:Uncharacterized protein n=1 Tax=Acorus gramineus TaxID=55184 RepID=A0AAV9BH42_ACOGR|nr:hypothetical protein QJS04_geneDACA012871 [Acorus gramineus]